MLGRVLYCECLHGSYRASVVSLMTIDWQLSPFEDSCEEHTIGESGMSPFFSIHHKGHEVQNQPHQVNSSFGNETEHYHMVHSKHHICVAT